MDFSHYRQCVAIFLIKQNYILSCNRIGFDNAWQLPQGGINSGENLLDAAKRELQEETGVFHCTYINETKSTYYYDFPANALKNNKIKYGNNSYIGQIVTFIAFEFHGRDTEINLNQKNAEFDAWQWMEFDDLIKYVVQFKKDLYIKAYKELDLI